MSRTRHVEIPVVEVTLLEDRARVRRHGRVAVAAGTSRLRVTGVAPVLVDKSLSARVREGDGVRVVDARVHRRRVIGDEARPEAARALVDERRAIEREQSERSDRRAVLVAERDALDALVRTLLAEISEDVAWGRGGPEEWRVQLDELGAREQAVIDEIRALDQSERAARERLGRLLARQRAQDTPASEAQAEVELTLMAEAEAEVALELDYVVPGACWRPYHSARLIDAGAATAQGARVQFRCEGCVWQNTGEDWREVTLRFSTQRASLGVTPPFLAEDRLSVQRKSSELVVEAREQEITTTGLGGVKSELSAELPGIDDAGDVVTLRGAHPATVPSDGAPYRVMLFEFESGADTELLVAAELTPAVLLRTTQVNRSPYALLAGPVDLLRDAGHAGRTSLLYIAPGETFELGWGPEPALRVHRRDARLEDESRMLSSWTTHRHKITVRLSNLGADEATVRVKERVPVSEIDKVKISVSTTETTGGVQPDSDGFLTWTVPLDPFGHDTVILRYDVKKHDDVSGLS
ncbi:mucoidy inhibitor MuiA family protein [Haliangium sp.]|uniref:mucoidy inhibitor MuiA family protein n=1 Tax=Haliangium sp. TaxID=2663208 RepID=UPI003D0A3D89